MSTIRAATDADIPGIQAIWNPLIRDTDITFNSIEKTAEAIAEFLEAHKVAGDPVLVLEVAGQIAGFAAYHPFRAGPGYARTKEVTISLITGHQRAGHGQKMVQALEKKAKESKIHVLVAGITETNITSRQFFAKQGYVQVGLMPEVGWKFGRLHDLVLMQKIL